MSSQTRMYVSVMMCNSQGEMLILQRSDSARFAPGQWEFINGTPEPHETAEELSVLSAELAILHTRRAGALNRNLGLTGSAWALVASVRGRHLQLPLWAAFAAGTTLGVGLGVRSAWNCQAGRHACSCTRGRRIWTGSARTTARPCCVGCSRVPTSSWPGLVSGRR